MRACVRRARALCSLRPAAVTEKRRADDRAARMTSGEETGKSVMNVETVYREVNSRNGWASFYQVRRGGTRVKKERKEEGRKERKSDGNGRGRNGPSLFRSATGALPLAVSASGGIARNLTSAPSRLTRRAGSSSRTFPSRAPTLSLPLALSLPRGRSLPQPLFSHSREALTRAPRVTSVMVRRGFPAERFNVRRRIPPTRFVARDSWASPARTVTPDSLFMHER